MIAKLKAGKINALHQLPQPSRKLDDQLLLASTPLPLQASSTLPDQSQCLKPVQHDRQVQDLP
jgi:hypothetical protein